MYKKGQVLSILGGYQDAITCYKIVFDWDPQDSEALLKMGVNNRRGGINERNRI